MLRLRKEALTFEGFVTDRLGKYSSDESITSLAEFVVQKITTRHSVGNVLRNLKTFENAQEIHVPGSLGGSFVFSSVKRPQILLVQDGKCN